MTVKLIFLETKMNQFLSRFTTSYFFSIPPETQIIWFWFGCFVALFLITFAIYLVLRARAFKEKPYKRYSKNFFWPNITLAIIGLLLTFSRYEKLALLSYRFWVYVTVLFVIVFNAWYFMIKRNQLEDELLKFYNTERKAKWLNKTKN